jgi:hypothetical protein
MPATGQGDGASPQGTPGKRPSAAEVPPYAICHLPFAIPRRLPPSAFRLLSPAICPMPSPASPGTGRPPWVPGKDSQPPSHAPRARGATNLQSPISNFQSPPVSVRAPPPPAPFFPSRDFLLRELEKALKAPNGSPVVFLCAEPGAGKTSVVSQLANRRVDNPFDGAICLRYFAFRPITPDSPLIPPDADHFVQADRLWFSLLSQLRGCRRADNALTRRAIICCCSVRRPH